ncbi:hypothetical protein BWI15_00090 [Kribbella sp. ALI-6-A]|uniref:LysR family transcriptional regulator n=1 Tax=Kribbella sp. ALI-6-A TaxID=1933817 RepID=UPI00097BCDB2|nr:LysR family transcriptional regulator [Kribbella sp. ALI-6-A]ONI79082.1 hypothetical protein BWI15_00090 [Kribbella sp. ALI-6-A]
MLDVRKLVLLRAVADEGSIAAAARSLSYTRSAVSQQLSALEAEIGINLVDRKGNQITLTPIGHALVEHTERILVALRAAEAMLDVETGTVGGLLRVGVPFREGPVIMREALTEMRSRVPSLEIQLLATTDDTAAEEVRRGALDMAIVSRFGPTRPRRNAGLREWTLGADPLRLCVPSDHRLADRESCTMVELSEESWIASQHTPLGRLTVTLCNAAGFDPMLAAVVDDLGAALGLVSIGWGITIAPQLTPVSPESSLRRIRIRGINTTRKSVLIVRDGEFLSPRIAAAVAAVREASGRSKLGG